MTRDSEETEITREDGQCWTWLGLEEGVAFTHIQEDLGALWVLKEREVALSRPV